MSTQSNDTSPVASRAGAYLLPKTPKETALQKGKCMANSTPRSRSSKLTGGEGFSRADVPLIQR